MKKVLAIVIGLVAAAPAFASEVVNIYSFRQPFLIKPILDDFTKQTGIKTNVVFANKGLIERVKREGKHSKADIVLTSNFSALIQLEELKLTQTINSEKINNNVPAAFRDGDGQWIALTKRVRSVYSAKDRLGALPELSYEDLADVKYQGKICTRSGKHPYNLGLVASMIAHHGEAQTKTWLESVKANLARKPQGNDRAQVKAVKEGLCDLALGNSYYLGKILQDESQKAWADAVHINFPNQTNRGSHINVSGAVMTKYAKNPENALKLLEYMTDNKAQNMYASVNMEYPVKPGVELSTLVASWGRFKEDSLPLDEISKYRPLALKLIDEVKFDL